jgi:hypothetical protein
MTLVIGTDEAGYGPNLGPLVVAATAWRIGAEAASAEATFAAVGEAAAEAAGGGPLWGDSKRIYRGGDGFAALERGALVAAALAGGRVPTDWAALARALSMEAGQPPPEAGELAGIVLPLAAQDPGCDLVAAAAAARIAAVDATLVAIRCRAVQPREFNALLDRGLNKSDILSAVTLDLAAALVAAADDSPLLVWCDRHGGRRRYAPVVSRAFAAPLVRTVEETAARSAYVLDEPACRIEFCVGGESRLPVAVASMTAKYVRELAMHAFNAFWAARQPGLVPTAGYPVDAVRWRRDADAAVRDAGLHWDDLWRQV